MASYYCQTVNLVGIKDGREEPVPVRKVVLERSPVFQSWIRDPDTVPESVRYGADFRFKKVRMEVLQALVQFLERSENGIDAIQGVVPPDDMPILLLDLYKLALSLGMHDLSDYAFGKLRTSSLIDGVFLTIVARAGEGDLLGNKRLRDWFVSSIVRRREAIQTSQSEYYNDLRLSVIGAGHNTWFLCSALLSLVGEMASEREELAEGGEGKPLTPQSSPGSQYSYTRK
ncbi:hypothetical protein NKR23_g3325 [Pleurostoma richardsiae]|uniref:BTB domain-containing protein n=1 Tax=Pleurostoma richardsiae TaxID=41990 RepID=A0AA38VWP0_9PEZI|nr:hypothetical protein NKR23_g3325 [Pleurostoma richardsiae]